MKEIFNEIRNTVSLYSDESCFMPDNTMVVSENRIKQILDEAEAKWEAELQKHDIEVCNKAIAEFEEQMKFEYREAIGIQGKARYFAEAVIEQVAHSLTISEVE